MDSKLYHSAKTGNILLLKQLLNENPGLVLNLTPHENTPLHIAARFGNKNVVSEIYNRQQSLLSQPNLDGDTPLHVAAIAGHFTTVCFLVEEILSLSSRDIENMPKRGIEMLRLRNRRNNTVLYEAVRNHHLRVAEFLIMVDPKLASFVNNMGESPLYAAARDGMLKIVNRLLMEAPSSAHGGYNGQTALHAAVMERHYAWFGNKNVVSEIYNRQQSLLSRPNLDRDTPLHVAPRAGHFAIVCFLVEEILSSSSREIKNRPNRIEILRLRNRGNNSVLHEAVRNHHLKFDKG